MEVAMFTLVTGVYAHFYSISIGDIASATICAFACNMNEACGGFAYEKEHVCIEFIYMYIYVYKIYVTIYLLWI